MPTTYVKKLAKEYHISVEEAESVWEQAKESVGRKDGEYAWPLVMIVFKRMIKTRTEKHRKP